MKISLKWLNDFVDLSEYQTNVQALADILTRAGLEVEDIQNRAQDFENLVVGHIQVKEKHPNADKLSVCQVEIATGKVSQIVCGAQNHKAGDKVIVALPGAVLPGNFSIKSSKIREVESHGMLCSLKELGLATESEGIEILEISAKVGEAYAVHAGYDDVIFELKVTPNRADCLSHYGLARELSCLLDKNLRPPEVMSKFSTQSTMEKIKLSVANTDLCPRYSGRYIAGVKISESPAWLKKRLEAIGVNSINNVVDVTNYVMYELGQPLHAFDAELIANKSILVRQAKAGELFKTLKDEEVKLEGEELLICDAEKPIALAGVIGGLNSGVSNETQNIFIESAYFKPMSVRKSARRHGIETDSAYRFSRGVDPSQTNFCMDRAVLLIQQLCGGEVYGSAHDIYPNPLTKKPISIKTTTVAERLGYKVDESLFLRFMKGLQIKIEKISDGNFNMTPPLFRFDLEQEMDLVEEYARLYGYEHIEETLPALSAEPVQHDSGYQREQKLSSLIRSAGFNQAFNYAFTSKSTEAGWLGDNKNLEKIGFSTHLGIVSVVNPLSEEWNSLRQTLSYGLWRNIQGNIRSGNNLGALFEIGSVFGKIENGYDETRVLGMASWGVSEALYSNRQPPIYKIRGAVEKILQSLQIFNYSFAKSEKSILAPPDFLHLGQWAAVIAEGQTIGYVGSVHPKHLENEKLREPVALAEINLAKLFKGQPRPLKFKSFSSLQPISRDFAFVLDAKKDLGDMLKEIKKACGASLKDISVFDIYQGEKLESHLKSVALKTTFQFEKVPTEADIQSISQKVIDSANRSAGAILR